jgi:multidrug transporter EmrE-like cation transporter
MKLMQKGIWSQIKQGKIFTKVFWKAILPILLYILFSISNIVFLTMAMHDIPASIAYAVWTGLVIGVSTVIDQVVLKNGFNWLKYLFLLMITLGIIGLKLSTQ